jgi:carboxylesterase type B
MGSGNEQMNGPDFLVTGDVVLVTINYRLGALGKATGLASVTTESAWLGFFT